MAYSNNKKKNKAPNASIYEAIGKMFLSSPSKGRSTNPEVLSLISRAVTMEQDPEYEELLEKPLWQFTGKDHEYMLRHVLTETRLYEGNDRPSSKKYVKGISGLASLFECSKSTAQRIKKSGVIDDAITQIGRKILIEADLALQLVKDSGYKVDEQ